MSTANKTLIFKQVPKGLPVAGQDLVVEDRPLDISAAPANGLVLQVLTSSYDPYLRGRMRAPEVKSYSPPFDLNGPIINFGVAKVLKSANPDFAEGDIVKGMLPLAQYAIVPDVKLQAVTKISNPHNLDAGVFIGPLGMPGLTAWSSLYEIGKPKKGETIFISSAAGAVGQVVAQIAKHEGLKVIGSVGSQDKLDFILNDLGFDGGFNYKEEKPLEALRRLAPEGIDIYYENVGGEQLEAALQHLNNFGRIIACGMISEYNKTPDERFGIKSLMQVVAKRLTIRGFIVGDADMGPVYAKEHHEKLSAWIADGTFKPKLHATEGIDNAAQGFVDMLEGKNFGKAILNI